MDSNTFVIADHHIKVVFADSSVNSMALLPSFGPFRIQGNDKPLLFTLTVDDSLRPAKDKQLIRNFDTGNGDTLVHQLANSGYQFIIRDIHGRDCCLLITNSDFSDCHCALNGDWVMRSFGLNDALMLVFAFAGSKKQTLLIHASCVEHGGYGYPFIAMSGTGKSTHTSLWIKHIDHTQLMNDDNPAIRIADDGVPYIYGTPWSGKTPCYRNIMAPLGAVTRIERAPQNSIERLQPVMAFASLLPACSSMKWDGVLYNQLCDTVTAIIEKVPIFTLYCLPDKEAALLCHKTIAH